MGSADGVGGRQPRHSHSVLQWALTCWRVGAKGSHIDLQLGQSHDRLHPIPKGVKVTVTENTKIAIEGIDKQIVGQLAADIRSYYPPEPYKAKGVRYAGEHIRRKAGKSVK